MKFSKSVLVSGVLASIVLPSCASSPKEESFEPSVVETSSVTPTPLASLPIEELKAFLKDNPTDNRFPASAVVLSTAWVMGAGANYDGSEASEELVATCKVKITNDADIKVAVFADVVFEVGSEQIDTYIAGTNNLKPGQSFTQEVDSTVVKKGSTFQCSIGDAHGTVPVY